jgi:hypothetical protein
MVMFDLILRWFAGLISLDALGAQPPLRPLPARLISDSTARPVACPAIRRDARWVRLDHPPKRPS